MKKKEKFVTYAVICMVLVIICGVESIFENPLGLIAFAAVFGVAISALAIAIEYIAEKINPQKTKKFIKTWMTPSEE